MPSKNRDAVVAFMPEKRREFAAKVPQDISNALGVINTLSAQYKQKQKTVAKPVAKQPMAKQTELPTVKQNKHVLMEFISVVADARAFAAAHRRMHSR